jgi:hypothetical protein
MSTSYLRLNFGVLTQPFHRLSEVFMGRAPRVDFAGHLHHALNRANRRATIFHKDADYEAMEHILTEAGRSFRACIIFVLPDANPLAPGIASNRQR